MLFYLLNTDDKDEAIPWINLKKNDNSINKVVFSKFSKKPYINEQSAYYIHILFIELIILFYLI